MPARAPLTVIGGFLGAGKTTLLNHLLRDAARAEQPVRYAVLVNDFGDLAIDESLIEAHDGTTIALANGCICCTIGDDLIETIMDLMEGPKPPEHLIIEASGVADPRPISELGSLDPNLTRDLTLVVIDAGQVRAQWADERLHETVARQISAADLLVLNKVEDLTAAQRAALTTWIAQQAPGIALTLSDTGRIPLSLLSTQVARALQQEHPSEHSHTDVFQTRTLAVNPALSLAAFQARLKALPASVLRAKGYVMLEGAWYLLQKVGDRSRVTRAPNYQSGDTDNRIVTISLETSQDISGTFELAP